MAFGLKREELNRWKDAVSSGKVAFITHYWFDRRFPQYRTVTKVGCSDMEKLIKWGLKYQLKPEWIDKRSNFPHFDLMGENEYRILYAEKCYEQIKKFRLGDDHDK